MIMQLSKKLRLNIETAGKSGFTQLRSLLHRKSPFHEETVSWQRNRSSLRFATDVKPRNVMRKYLKTLAIILLLPLIAANITSFGLKFSCVIIHYFFSYPTRINTCSGNRFVIDFSSAYMLLV